MTPLPRAALVPDSRGGQRRSQSEREFAEARRRSVAGKLPQLDVVVDCWLVLSPFAILSSMNDLKDSVDIVKNIFTVLGLLVGAAWAYFKFFKNRTLRPRLELGVEGYFFHHNHKSFLRVMVSVKNVGLTNVPIRQVGTGLLVCASSLAVEEATLGEVTWDDGPVFTILRDHAWIEPNEVITEDLLLAVPRRSSSIAYKLRCRVVPDRKRKRTEWNVTAVVPTQPDTTTSDS